MKRTLNISRTLDTSQPYLILLAPLNNLLTYLVLRPPSLTGRSRHNHRTRTIRTLGCALGHGTERRRRRGRRRGRRGEKREKRVKGEKREKRVKGEKRGEEGEEEKMYAVSFYAMAHALIPDHLYLICLDM